MWLQMKEDCPQDELRGWRSFMAVEGTKDVPSGSVAPTTVLLYSSCYYVHLFDHEERERR